MFLKCFYLQINVFNIYGISVLTLLSDFRMHIISSKAAQEPNFQKNLKITLRFS